MHGRGVERWHAAHADDEHAREVLDRDVVELVGHAKEHGAVDLVHADGARQLAQVRDLGILIAVVTPTAHLGLLAHHLHKEDDGDGDAGGKARGDGMRHKADERAQAHDAHNYQQHARDDGSRHQSAHAVGRHDTGDDGGERRRGTGDLYAC